MYSRYQSEGVAVATIVGILVGEGKLRVDQPAPIPAWQGAGDPRRAITVENLLHMSSGLASGGNDTPEGYWGGIALPVAAYDYVIHNKRVQNVPPNDALLINRSQDLWLKA